MVYNYEVHKQLQGIISLSLDVTSFICVETSIYYMHTRKKQQKKKTLAVWEILEMTQLYDEKFQIQVSDHDS